MPDTPRIEARDRERIGQVIVPIPLAAVETMTPTQLADHYVPIALATAKEHGGTIIGTPEILAETEILPRMADADPQLRRVVEEAERSAFLLCTMVAHDWTAFDAGDVLAGEWIRPAKRPRSERRRR